MNRLLKVTPLLLAMLAFAPAAHAETPCSRYASPQGNDANAGSKASPYRSIAKLTRSLAPGEHGCLPNGATFSEPIGTFIIDGAGGTPGAPVTVRTEDPSGPRAEIRGAMWLKATSHDITFERVRFTESAGGDRSTMLLVVGDRVTFRETEMTFPRGICLNAGQSPGNQAGGTEEVTQDLVIERSAIHDCGTSPATMAVMRQQGQSGLHGIYLIATQRAVIRDNVIYDNASKGISFWPNVDNSLIEHNVIDGNSTNINVGSAREVGRFSEGNRFEDNVISNGLLRKRYDLPWGPGDEEAIFGFMPNDGNTRGNVFSANCVHQPGGYAYGGYGYVHSGDVFADPQYADRAAKDFRLAAGSPCAGKGPRAGFYSDPDPAPPADSRPGPDRTLPRLRVERVLVRRRRVVAYVAVTEPATLRVALERRRGRRWAKPRVIRRVVGTGRSRLVLSRRLRPGRYRLSLSARDRAGNRSRTLHRRLRVRP